MDKWEFLDIVHLATSHHVNSRSWSTSTKYQPNIYKPNSWRHYSKSHSTQVKNFDATNQKGETLDKWDFLHTTHLAKFCSVVQIAQVLIPHVETQC